MKFHIDGNIPIMRKNSKTIFVFGSNVRGIHGAGAALAAVKLGAKYGVGVGLSGNTYAIPTKDGDFRPLPLDQIKKNIDDFIVFTKNNTEYNYYVTRIGCGLAGYSDSDIAPLFKEAVNCSFATSWKPYLNELR